MERLCLLQMRGIKGRDGHFIWKKRGKEEEMVEHKNWGGIKGKEKEENKEVTFKRWRVATLWKGCDYKGLWLFNRVVILNKDCKNEGLSFFKRVVIMKVVRLQKGYDYEGLCFFEWVVIMKGCDSSKEGQLWRLVSVVVEVFSFRRNFCISSTCVDYPCLQSLVASFSAQVICVYASFESIIEVVW